MNNTDVEESAHALANAVKRIEANLQAFRACLREAGAVGDPRGDLVKLARCVALAERTSMALARLRWAVTDAERAYLAKPEEDGE